MIRVREAVWYTLIGMMAAATHFLGLYLGVKFFHFSVATSNIFGFFWAFWVSFIGHFFLTFRASRLRGFSFTLFFTSLLRWLITSIGGFLLNQGLFLIGLKLMGEEYYLFIWLIVTLIVTIFTFLIGKFWGFRPTI